ncbi:MAG TPA: hypothetical protein IAA76_08855 [Candidatus Ornithospirochaeta stercorigallinarum]|nr:hypothetical protein [Candidatus Ornithospirochaeta stercorigallinarum]
MKTNRKVFLLAFLAIVLVLTSTSCSDPGRETKAEVRVIGTAVEKTRAVASNLSFGSGKVFVGDKEITDQLKPVSATDPEQQNQTSNNDVVFEADVSVIGDMVTYRVEHENGFVFDEWKIVNRRAIMQDYKDAWWDVLKEIWVATRGDNETIRIKPEYIKYIRPSFDRGIYVESGENIKTELEQYFNNTKGRYDDDELTIKLATGPFDFDLSGLSWGYGDDEIELELKIIGGYNDSSWNIIGDDKTTITNIGIPKLPYVEEFELELEFRNINFDEFDYSLFGKDDDFEIDFRNCSVGKLTNARGVVNGLMVNEIIKAANSSNLVIVNSVAPYVDGVVYYHSVVKNASGKTILGANNSIEYGSLGPEDDRNNQYVAKWDGTSYKTNDSVLIKKLITAKPLSEDFIEDYLDLDDDILEEDIEGRERFLFDDDWHRGISVSYGPYEYQWFDD